MVDSPSRLLGVLIIDTCIERCTVRRMSFNEGLVLNMDDHNELVISGRMLLSLPGEGRHPAEVVEIDPTHVSEHERPLQDLAGSVCTEAQYTDDGTLHLGFSRGHAIEVAADNRVPAWQPYAKHHGYLACMPGGRVRTVRHDLPTTVDAPSDIASRTP